ncbi:unnamed protein product, partial [Nesidiocoris tenuis]
LTEPNPYCKICLPTGTIQLSQYAYIATGSHFSYQVYLWVASVFSITGASAERRRPYHYASFVGPVSGDAEEISVPRAVAPYPYNSEYEQQNDMTFDYVAKPEYSFVYGVEDPGLGKSHNHEESRDGDVVKGEYSVLEPDGSVRRVVYTSDEGGFRATVTTTPPEKGWKLPPQPSEAIMDTSDLPDHEFDYDDDHHTYPEYENEGEDSKQRVYMKKVRSKYSKPTIVKRRTVYKNHH